MIASTFFIYLLPLITAYFKGTGNAKTTLITVLVILSDQLAPQLLRSPAFTVPLTKFTLQSR